MRLPPLLAFLTVFLLYQLISSRSAAQSKGPKTNTRSQTKILLSESQLVALDSSLTTRVSMHVKLMTNYTSTLVSTLTSVFMLVETFITDEELSFLKDLFGSGQYQSNSFSPVVDNLLVMIEKFPDVRTLGLEKEVEKEVKFAIDLMDLIEREILQMQNFLGLVDDCLYAEPDDKGRLKLSPWHEHQCFGKELGRFK